MSSGVVSISLGSVTVIVVVEYNCLLDLSRLLDLAGLFVFIKDRRSSLSSKSVDLVLTMVVPKGIRCDSST